MPDFGPEVGIVLFVLGNDASLRSVACNTSKQFLPTARYRCAIPNEGSRKAGAVNGLDAAQSYVLIKIEIHRADTCSGGGELLDDFGGRLEGLFDRGMQPPAISLADELRTAHLEATREIATEHVYFEPGPARAGPDFEHDRMGMTLVPEAR